MALSKTRNRARRAPSLLQHLTALLRSGALPAETRGFGAKAAEAAATFLERLAKDWRGADPIIECSESPRSPGLTRLGIINLDSPFLVDSLSAELTAQGFIIARLLHPVIKVQRSASGAIKGVARSQDRSSIAVSMLYVEVETPATLLAADLEQSLQVVLAAVKAAVSDWRAMQAEMRADAAQIGDEEQAALLHWFGSGYMTLLGHAEFSKSHKLTKAIGLAKKEAASLLSEAARTRAFKWCRMHPNQALLIKSNQLSPVHRRVPMDLLIVQRTGIGTEKRLSIFAGLWTSAALATPPAETPVLRRKLATVQNRLGFDPTGHAGKALAHALTNLPHDVLIAMEDEALAALAQTAMSVIDRPRPAIAIAASPLDRQVEAFVWLPRDDLNTNRRLAIGSKLSESCDAPILSWAMALDDSGIVLIRYTLDVRDGSGLPDVKALDAWLTKYLRGWTASVQESLVPLVGRARASEIATSIAPGFPQFYRDLEGPAEAAADAVCLSQLSEAQPYRARLYARDQQLHLKLFARGISSLSATVPALENFGFHVLGEDPTQLADGLGVIHDFTLEQRAGTSIDPILENAPQIVLAFEGVLSARVENDRFNSLMVDAGLDEAAVLFFRALFRYLRQIGLGSGLNAVVDALGSHPAIASELLRLFAARHSPGQANKAKADASDARIVDGITQVTSVDEDRILRLFRAAIRACLRTNFHAPAAKEALAFKFDSAAIPGMPDPKPWREIFVYSPRIEGIHLRAGPVARGGLRWSDRRDDFRTEVLGLMKAQRVKNAVIVPTGAKGGFYPKLLPDPAQDREAWATEGKEAYRIFIWSLLSITDNIVDGKVVHPEKVVIRDGEDPYFVVAADKGTATFSDVANAIALERGFWLGDAFASGGSQGYDHKAMGITAKGGWVSVTRHFAEMGIDVQRDPIRVVGCGDMSGDVFGNGMLLSKAIKLVAAFDHRHIFLDPDPNPEQSWEERARLFRLPRSSWADYNRERISSGGGVFPRNAKSIELSPQVRAALDIDQAELEPAQLIAAILKAPVGLIWFGGIGTYVKASSESHADAGDRANDVIRINANALRAKVVGEGANLGMTQAARIEFGLSGGRVNTDFIDNSAGVDCSDNEVNIKIALNGEISAGRLTEPVRNRLLKAMTEEVSSLVLEDNRLQTLAISIAEREGASALPTQIRLIERLKSDGLLDRTVEGIASNDILLRRIAEGKGLTRPELAVIMATAKLALQDAIEETALSQDAAAFPLLQSAFPKPMQKRFGSAIEHHRLRGEIIATKLANRVINRLGPVLPFELAEEESVTLGDVAEAFVIVEALLDLPALWAAVDKAPMPESTRLMLYDQIGVEVQAHMGDVLRHAVEQRSNHAAIAAYAPGLAQLSKQRESLLGAETSRQAAEFLARLTAVEVPNDIARAVVRLAQLDGAIGLSAVSSTLRTDVAATTRAFTQLGEALGLDWAQGNAMRLDPIDPWERLLAAGLARDFQTLRLHFITQLGNKKPDAAVQKWLKGNEGRVKTFRKMLDSARTSPATTAMLAQISGQARMLLSR